MNDLSEYKARNELLRQMGFCSYKKYLKSPLWLGIRARALIGKPRCSACNLVPASSVHHLSYSLEVLKGQDVTQLMPICWTCHEAIEFADGEKTSVEQSRQLFNLLAGKAPKAHGKFAVIQKKCTGCNGLAAKGSTDGLCGRCRRDGPRNADGIITVPKVEGKRVACERCGRRASRRAGYKLCRQCAGYAQKAKKNGMTYQQITWGDKQLKLELPS